MTKKTPADPVVRKTIRLPASMYAELEKAAAYHGHSTNTEMVERLKAAAMADQFGLLLKELGDLKALDREILDALSRRTK